MLFLFLSLPGRWKFLIFAILFMDNFPFLRRHDLTWKVSQRIFQSTRLAIHQSCGEAPLHRNPLSSLSLTFGQDPTVQTEGFGRKRVGPTNSDWFYLFQLPGFKFTPFSTIISSPLKIKEDRKMYPNSFNLETIIDHWKLF